MVGAIYQMCETDVQMCGTDVQMHQMSQLQMAVA